MKAHSACMQVMVVCTWPRPGEHLLVVRIRTRHIDLTPGLMFWRAISYKSCSPLVCVKGTMTSHEGVALFQRDSACPYNATCPTRHAASSLAGMMAGLVSNRAHVWRDGEMSPARLVRHLLLRSCVDRLSRREVEYLKDSIRHLCDRLHARICACVAACRGYAAYCGPFMITSNFYEALLKLFFQNIPLPHAGVATAGGVYMPNAAVCRSVLPCLHRVVDVMNRQARAYAVKRRTHYSSPTEVNQVQFLAGSHVAIVPDDATGRWGFLGDLPFLPYLHSGVAPYSPSVTLVGSQYHDSVYSQHSKCLTLSHTAQYSRPSVPLFTVAMLAVADFTPDANLRRHFDDLLTRCFAVIAHLSLIVAQPLKRSPLKTVRSNVRCSLNSLGGSAWNVPCTPMHIFLGNVVISICATSTVVGPRGRTQRHSVTEVSGGRVLKASHCIVVLQSSTRHHGYCAAISNVSTAAVRNGRCDRHENKAELVLYILAAPLQAHGTTIDIVATMV
ncbi:hypothetical protein PR048_021393 [Dryococelus australis]|uniref:Uncharacterized protein n=1 Tax=Dryococelus australis TaxID=614101 RepID=A0ABQ9GY31_9NEOP|nr:hypothetical protein PR048_021393 [Dryococelus australis]